jgi:ABC-type spermidine/putrescine transport system permease subunit II
VTPDINALASLIILAISLLLLGAWLIARRSKTP